MNTVPSPLDRLFEPIVPSGMPLAPMRAQGRLRRDYSTNGRLVGAELKAQAVESLVADWDRDYDPSKTTLILAHLCRDVRTLHILARRALVERGLVVEGFVFRTEDGNRSFATGDQVVFLKNEGPLGVKDGMLAKVVEASPGRLVAEVGEGESRRQVTVEQRFYTNIDHG